MLVYDGNYELENIELIRRIAQQEPSWPKKSSAKATLDMQKTLHLSPPVSKARLILNRILAILFFIILNGLSYFVHEFSFD